MTNFNEIYNPHCFKGCSKVKRKINTDGDICRTVRSVADDKPIRCVGDWGMEKIHYLNQYLGIFSDGMKYKWEGKINYIEICSGPGRCINRSNGIEFDGTALTILNNQASKYLKRALFFDINPEVIETLNLRIKAINAKNAIAFIGDYHNPASIIEQILNQTGKYGLFLVFIDPTDCSLPFGLITELKKSIKNIDFIINLASGTDFNRNIGQAILNKDRYKNLVNKYTAFLNSDSIFRDPIAIKFARENRYIELRTMFRDIYMDSLRMLGYEYFEFKRIKHFYDLIFASSHPKGLEFWNKVNKTGYDGQRSLF